MPSKFTDEMFNLSLKGMGGFCLRRMSKRTFHAKGMIFQNAHKYKWSGTFCETEWFNNVEFYM